MSDAAIIAGNSPVTCLKCGYRLAGLAANGKCPECEFSVAHSVRGDLIADAGAGHRATLRRGVAMIAGAVALLAVVSLFPWALSVLMSWWSIFPDEWLAWAVVISTSVGNLLLFGGWFALTATGVGGAACVSPRIKRLAWWTRALHAPMFLWACVGLLYGMLELADARPMRDLSWSARQVLEIGFVMFGWFAAICFAGWLVVSMRFVGAWTARLQFPETRERLRRRALLLGTLQLVAFVLVPIACAVFTFAFRWWSFRVAYTALLGAAHLFGLVVAAMVVALMVSVRRAVRRDALFITPPLIPPAPSPPPPPPRV